MELNVATSNSEPSNISVFEPGSYTDSRRPSASQLQIMIERSMERYTTKRRMNTVLEEDEPDGELGYKTAAGTDAANLLMTSGNETSTASSSAAAAAGDVRPSKVQRQFAPTLSATVAGLSTSPAPSCRPNGQTTGLTARRDLITALDNVRTGSTCGLPGSELSDVEPSDDNRETAAAGGDAAAADATLPNTLQNGLEESKGKLEKWMTMLQEMERCERLNPALIDDLLRQATEYEQQLIDEKEKLRQRLGFLSSILSADRPRPSV